MTKSLRESFNEYLASEPNSDDMGFDLARLVEQHYASAQPDGLTERKRMLRAFTDALDEHLRSFSSTGETSDLGADDLRAELAGANEQIEQMQVEIDGLKADLEAAEKPDAGEVEFDHKRLHEKWAELELRNTRIMQDVDDIVEWALATFKSPAREMPRAGEGVMTIDIEALRPAFEAWATTQGWFDPDEDQLRRIGETYVWFYPELCFDGFCAAMESLLTDEAVERAARANVSVVWGEKVWRDLHPDSKAESIKIARTCILAAITGKTES